MTVEPTRDALSALRLITLFESLDDRALRSIAACAQARTFAAGEELVREGELGLAVFFLVEGHCSVSRHMQGEQRKITELHPGDFFGEMAVLDPGPRTATVTALSDVSTYALAACDFKAQMEAVPDVPRKILPLLARRFRAANEQLVRLGEEAGDISLS